MRLFVFSDQLFGERTRSTPLFDSSKVSGPQVDVPVNVRRSIRRQTRDLHDMMWQPSDMI